jgi:hypothetical protein
MLIILLNELSGIPIKLRKIMKHKMSFTFICIILFIFISTISLIYAQDSTLTSNPPNFQSSTPSFDSSLIEPGTLAKALSDSKAAKPLIFHVGVTFQFKTHIPGAKHTGMASTPEGIKTLKQAAENLERSKEIILYCGCCPWKDCPNIRPAFRLLQHMGFTKVKVLHIPKNFQTDWIDKNFPIEKSKD